MGKKAKSLFEKRDKYKQKIQFMQWDTLEQALKIVDRITKIELKLLKMGYAKLVERK